MTTECIVNVDAVVGQAWETKGLAVMRAEVEDRLRQERQKIARKFRAEGKKAYCWGYADRKTLITRKGELGPLRIPRLRVDGQEIRLIPRPLRRTEGVNQLMAQTVVAGASQRQVEKLFLEGRRPCSVATIGRVVTGLGEAVERLRHRSLARLEYVALAIDGIWGKYRERGDAVLATAIGIRGDGSFDAIDWEASAGETTEMAENLFTRLFERGLRPRLIVADGAEAYRSAQEIVFPAAQWQPCLWHRQRQLIRSVSFAERDEWARDYWEVYNGLTLTEALQRGRQFELRWRRREPEATKEFAAEFGRTLSFLNFPHQWRHRLRTVNLAEGFFRNFRRFFNRYPGFKDEEHLVRTLGLYLLGVRPQRWTPAGMRLVA